MKKLIILLTVLLPSCTISFGQTKIGDITIADTTAKKFFLYCYQHPDTLTREYVDGCGNGMEKKVEQYNDWLTNASIEHIVVSIKHPAYIDTVRSSENGIMIGETHECPYGSIKHEITFFMSDKHKNVIGYKGHEKEFEIMKIPEWTDKVEIGFAVPKKPTEENFIKWINTEGK